MEELDILSGEMPTASGSANHVPARLLPKLSGRLQSRDCLIYLTNVRLNVFKYVSLGRPSSSRLPRYLHPQLLMGGFSLAVRRGAVKRTSAPRPTAQTWNANEVFSMAGRCTSTEIPC